MFGLGRKVDLGVTPSVTGLNFLILGGELFAPCWSCFPSCEDGPNEDDWEERKENDEFELDKG